MTTAENPPAVADPREKFDQLMEQFQDRLHCCNDPVLLASAQVAGAITMPGDMSFYRIADPLKAVAFIAGEAVVEEAGFTRQHADEWLADQGEWMAEDEEEETPSA